MSLPTRSLVENRFSDDGLEMSPFLKSLRLLPFFLVSFRTNGELLTIDMRRLRFGVRVDCESLQARLSPEAVSTSSSASSVILVVSSAMVAWYSSALALAVTSWAATDSISFTKASPALWASTRRVL